MKLPKVYSANEWAPLESIVVGSALGACWPDQDPVFQLEKDRTLWKKSPLPSGPVAPHVIEESEEDLDALADILEKQGVTVHRPQHRDFEKTNGMYNYCPRDRLLVADATVVDCAMMYPSRDQEIETLSHVLEDVPVIKMPRDSGMVLDAANVCRLGDTWLFLESNSGNQAAYQWLCEQFPEKNIEKVNFYAGVHIDSTICAISDSTVLVNSQRVKLDQLPEALSDWNIIWVDDVVAQDFYEYPYASKWIAMNVLSVDPGTVVVDRKQDRLINTLERNNFTVIPHELRHSRTLGGGFHCVTLDLKRRHV